MPVYIVTTPTSQRLVSAPSRRIALDFIISSSITAMTVSSPQMAEYIKAGLALEFVERPAVVDDGQVDIEDITGRADGDVESALSEAA